MTAASYVLGIAAALLTLGIVIEMLRRRRLRERHAIWWLLAGLLALVIGVFPQVLEWASSLIGIEVPTNLVFFISLLILFLVCLQHSAELTQVEDRTRTLAEQVAFLELRLGDLEERTANSDDRP